MLVVAQQKIPVIQHIIEATRRQGHDVRWLNSWELAPCGSVAFFTPFTNGKWTQSAGKKILVEVPDPVPFQEIEKVVEKILSSKSAELLLKTEGHDLLVSAKADQEELERLRKHEIQTILSNRSLR